MDIEDDDDDIYDDIIRLRAVTRRTNWRHRSTSLSQRDVALAATIHASLSSTITLMYIVICQLNFLYNAILLNNDRQSAIFGRLLRALQHYQCLFRFCCHEIDFLIEEEADVLYLHQDQIIPVITEPPRNRAINELTDEVAYSLTWFTKEQLHQLLLH
jgi:hypothetical protein